ncbi:uncharacterized protein ACA1_198460 [Acanthamoeba castellanii str. Neff]|uniref:Uncharacterized protein n=1 Tax=Acanthamoeba castellanii (strain ATCC 30010 / Neff) TaxID=1257118 RepID=L8H361_ACACF|nr:uncharacterized protein ACA1_198460 [Acanthamoeba castellanii str. Neff]ELR19625.1 hypothetical protein ACA1_198460 [Acanthamoeba castellanii str. Neff]
MEERNFEELLASISAAAAHVNEVPREQQQQEVVDALVSLLDVPAALSAEQRERLFDLLLPLLRPDKPLLGRVFFDIFHGLLGFLPYPETQPACTQIVNDIAATCNPREMWIVCTEALGRPQPTATKVLLLHLLSQVLRRLPESSRPRFLRSGLSLAASLLRPKDERASGDDDEEEDSDEMDEEYRLAPDTESFAKAALELARPFVSKTTTPLAREEGELVLGFLMAVLAGPVARAPLESRPKNKPHAGYSGIASTVLELLLALGWSVDRVLSAAATINPSGVGVYAYLVFVQPPDVTLSQHCLPMVSSSLYSFCRILPSLSQLLREPAPNASFKGHRLLVHFTDLLRGSAGEVSEPVLAGLGASLDQWRELCKDVITYMVSNPVEGERQTAYGCLGALFTLLGPWERFRVLGSLLQDCPYAAVAGLLVARLKDETLRAWPARGSPAGTHCPPFASPKLVDLFPHFMHCKAPIEQLDLLMHSLNFYRFLLLRDRGAQAVVGVWRPDLVEWVKAQWLLPLREEYSTTLGEEAQQQKIAMLTQHGFPQLSPEDMQHASTASLTALAPLTDLIDWVFSLLDEQQLQLAPVRADPSLLPRP